jgi:hypothetical protein
MELQDLKVALPRLVTDEGIRRDWREPHEQNAPSLIERSFDAGPKVTVSTARQSAKEKGPRIWI